MRAGRPSPSPTTACCGKPYKPKYPSKKRPVAGSCPAVVGDILVYRDGNHLSNTMAAWLAPVVDALVGPFVEDYVRYRAAVG